VLRVSDNATFDGLDQDSLITKAENFAKSDTAAGIIKTVKGYLSRKDNTPAPAAPFPYTVAPTTTEWSAMQISLVVGAGVLVVAVLAWALLRK